MLRQPYLRRKCSYLALGRQEGSQVVEEGILCKEGPQWREFGREETALGIEYFGHGNMHFFGDGIKRTICGYRCLHPGL